MASHTVVVPLTGLRVPLTVYLLVILLLLVLAALGVALVLSRYQACPCPLCRGTYTLQRVLGKGSFGEVWTANKQREEGTRFAIKMLKVQDVAAANEGVDEATKVAMCKHPNVVSLHEQFFHHVVGVKAMFYAPYSFCIVTELCSEGDLHEILQDKDGALPEREGLHMTAQITEGLHALHQRSIVHGDLKPENIFVSQQQGGERLGSHVGTSRIYKIGDLGLAQHSHNIVFSQVGTRGFIAPEILSDKKREYGVKVDIWSLGMVLLECCLGLQVTPAEAVALGKKRLSAEAHTAGQLESAELLFSKAFEAGQSQAVRASQQLNRSAKTSAKATSSGDSKASADFTQLVLQDSTAVQYAVVHIKTTHPEVGSLVDQMLEVKPTDRPSCLDLMGCVMLEAYISRDAKDQVKSGRTRSRSVALKRSESLNAV